MRRLVALALLSLAACVEETEGSTDEQSVAARQTLLAQDRYVVRESVQPFDETLASLMEALDRRDLTVFAVIDHAAAAESVDLALPRSVVVIFGDPEAGTALIEAVPVLGAELPLRALVYEEEGGVFVAVTGMANIARSYSLRDQSEVTDDIERTLAEIASEVTER